MMIFIKQLKQINESLLFTFTLYKPLCLPPVINDDPDKYEGRAVIATGWGSQNDLKTLTVANLKELDLTVFDLG